MIELADIRSHHSVARLPDGREIDCSAVDKVEYAMMRLLKEYPDQIIVPEYRTDHLFSDGLYSRTVTLPKGCIVTGRIHTTKHMAFLLKGDITIWAEKEGLRRIQAPVMFAADPGTRRVAFTHEEVVWTTVHATTETDLNKLEQELLLDYTNPLLEGEEFLCLL